MLSELKQHSHKHSHMDSEWPIPRCLGLASVSEGVRIIYLAYIQVPNAADKVKFLFEIWKSGQNLKLSTATTHQKKTPQLWQEMCTFLPKNICRSVKCIVEGCMEVSLFLFQHC